MAEPLSVLIVCRANVCRSPLAALLMERYLEAAGRSGEVVVRSVGTDVTPGAPTCQEAAEWSGVPGADCATGLTSADLAAADLVLAADRVSRSACASLGPGCRPRLFTLRQAAHLAEAVEAERPLNIEPEARLRWLVGEWDAARGLLAGREEAQDDIVDRHGAASHVEVFEELDSAVRSIVDAFGRSAAPGPI